MVMMAIDAIMLLWEEDNGIDNGDSGEGGH